MKTYLDCIPCFFRQALDVARITGVDEHIQKQIIDEISRIVPDIPFALSPPEMAGKIYSIINNITGNIDPYCSIKNKSTDFALSIYPRLKQKIEQSDDRLLTALELAIVGNIIDYGVKNSLDIDKEVNKLLNNENQSISTETKKIFDYERFFELLKYSKNILYLADNAGETVFDRLFIEEIKRLYPTKDILYVVKEKPIINDAVFSDAVAAGLDGLAKIISSGVTTPGTVLSLCSKEFLDIFNNADFVISKGQGNFEALSDAKRSICFLLMAKCPVIVKHISENIGECKLGDIILHYHE